MSSSPYEDVLIRKYFLELLLRGKVSEETLMEIKKAFGTDDIKPLIKNHLSIKNEVTGYSISFGSNPPSIFINYSQRNNFLRMARLIGLNIDQDIAKEMIHELTDVKDVEFRDNELTIHDLNGNEIVLDDREIKVIKNGHVLTRIRYDSKHFTDNDIIIIGHAGISYRDKKYIVYADLFTDILKNEGFTEQFSEDGKYFATKTVQDGTNTIRIEVSIDDDNRAEVKAISDEVIPELHIKGVRYSINKEGKYEYSATTELSSLDNVLYLHMFIKDAEREKLSIGDIAIIYYYMQHGRYHYFIVDNIYNDKLSYVDIVERAINNISRIHHIRSIRDLFLYLATSGILKYTNDDIMIGDKPLIKTMEEDKMPALDIADAVDNALYPIFSLAIRYGIPTPLIEKLAQKGYISGKLLSVEIEDRLLWHYLSYEAKDGIIRRFVDNGHHGDLEMITEALEKRGEVNELTRFIAPNVCNGGYPDLCTRIIAKYRPNILGFNKLAVTDDDKIEFPDVYVQISRLGGLERRPETEFIITDKKNNIKEVIRAKNLREAIAKFYGKYGNENATVKA